MPARSARKAAHRTPERRGSRSGADPGAPLPGERWWLLGLLAVALGLRVFLVHGTYLVPDEAIFVDIATAPDVATVYRLTTEQAHPPLYFFLLHFWARIVSSDFAFRLPSVLMAVASVGLLYAWTRRRAGPLAAFAATALFALSPSIADLTSEVRQYSLLLLLSAGALLAASPPEGHPSWRRLASVAGLTVAAAATHYSGFLLAAALLVSLAFDLRRGGATRKDWLGLGAVVVSLALWAGFMWASHVRTLSGGALEAEARSGWLRPYYLQDGAGLAGFVASATAGVYAFLTGLPGEAGLIALVALAAVSLRARKDPGVAVLLLAPFAVAVGAAALRVYPFGATRHSAWLLPAAAFALSLPLAGVRPAATRWVLPALAVLLPVWASQALRSPLSAIPREDRRQAQMEGLLSTLAARVGPTDVVFVDTQTAWLLRRYLGGRPPAGHDDEPLRREVIGRMDVWVSRTWLHDAPTFVRELSDLEAEAGLLKGQRIWVVNAGSAARLLPQLVAAYPRAPVASPTGFGNSLWAFQIAVP